VHLLVGMQSTPGSNNDILTPQLLTTFSLVPFYHFTYLSSVMPFEPLVSVPVHRKAWLDNCTVNTHYADLLRPRSHVGAMSLLDALGACL
jgi:hypothetical protein